MDESIPEEEGEGEHADDEEDDSDTDTETEAKANLDLVHRNLYIISVQTYLEFIHLRKRNISY